jgi:hypothetical protein
LTSFAATQNAAGRFYGGQRKTGARLMRGLASDAKLYSVRQLVVNAVQ